MTDRLVNAKLDALLVELARRPAYLDSVVSAATVSEAADVHVADSLAGLQLEAISVAGLIADIGSGAGFPALPLAAALPVATLEAIDSNRRKTEAVEKLARHAGIQNVRPIWARVEEWGQPESEGYARYDVVTARALASLPVLLEYAAPLLVVGGRFVAWKGRRMVDEETQASAAAVELGMSLEQVLAVKPFDSSRERHLHVYRKTRLTPARFPRRSGVAEKKPLGAEKYLTQPKSRS